MTRDEANSLLDRLRAGEHFDRRVIRAALIVADGIGGRPAKPVMSTPESALTRLDGWVECWRVMTKLEAK